MKRIDVFPSKDAPSETITDWVLPSSLQKSGWFDVPLFWAAAWTRSFWEFRGASMVNHFSSVNQIFFTAFIEWKHRRSLFFAPLDSSWTVTLLKTFKFRSFLTIHWIDEWEIPVLFATWCSLQLVPGLPSWLRISCSTVLMFSSVLALFGRALPGRCSILPVSRSFFKNFCTVYFFHSQFGYPFKIWFSKRYFSLWRALIKTLFWSVSRQ